jgi:hypothetical protein
VFATNEDIDCQDAARDDEALFPQVVVQQLQKISITTTNTYTLQIFTDKDLRVALRHNQQFCCQ